MGLSVSGCRSSSSRLGTWASIISGITCFCTSPASKDSPDTGAISCQSALRVVTVRPLTKKQPRLCWTSGSGEGLRSESDWAAPPAAWLLTLGETRQTRRVRLLGDHIRSAMRGLVGRMAAERRPPRRPLTGAEAPAHAPSVPKLQLHPPP